MFAGGGGGAGGGDGGHWSDDAVLDRANSDLSRRAAALEEAVEQAERDCIRALDNITVDTGGLSSAEGDRDSRGSGVQGSAVMSVDWDAVTTGTVFDMQLLKGLAGMSPLQLERWADQNGDLLVEMMNHNTDPDVVANWWASLGGRTAPDVLSDRQKTLLTHVPEVLGNREGLPYTVRDSANRAVLEATIEQLEAEIAVAESQFPRDPHPGTVPTGSETAAMAAAASASSALAALTVLRQQVGQPTAVGTRPGLIQTQLVNLDTSVVPPLAAVSIGDVDRASHVSVMVSGMSSSVEGSTMQALTDAEVVQTRMASELGGDGEPAMIVWLDYESPNLLTVALPGHAQDGGERLADATRGVTAAAEQRGADPYLSVLAHSYGTTTTVEALKEEGTGIDVVAMYGSPGVYASSPDDFTMPADGIYATHTWSDWVAAGGRADRTLPLDIDGVEEFSSTSQTAPDGTELAGSWWHSEYLLDGSTSVYNLGLIAAGEGDKVIP